MATYEDSYRLSNGIPDAEAISSYEATGVPGSIMRRPDVPAAPPAPPERFGPPMMAGPRTGFEDPPIPAATHPDDGMPVSSTMPPGAGDPGTVGSGRPAPAKASDRATESRTDESAPTVLGTPAALEHEPIDFTIELTYVVRTTARCRTLTEALERARGLHDAVTSDFARTLRPDEVSNTSMRVGESIYDARRPR